MNRLSKERAIYEFAAENEPAYHVDEGERVLIETQDAFSGQLTSSDQLFDDVDMSAVNPATGPICVRGLSKGDTLCADLEDIRCGAWGVIACSSKLGNLAELVKRSRTKVVEIRDDRAHWSDSIALPIDPHVGVIGVSPPSGRIPTFHPGDFGGNMDTKEARKGAKVYLPTFVDGAMVSLGDVHAVMGDGEVSGTGIEVSAEIEATFSGAEDVDVKRPLIETPTDWICYAAADTLDDAARLATLDAISLIMRASGVDFEEAYLLASATCDLAISQVVDPLVAAKMIVPKSCL
ncbi:MAG: acetamidase/formamidase family protein [Methanobacteriota archaeon]|nr:MAG: acetamidase/formamidase family protein [Euryarchaeota archaeon]